MAELQMPVSSIRKSFNRVAASIAVLVLIGAMLPACAAMCCASQTATARMMAAMPCCAHTPSVKAPRAASGLQNAMLTGSPKPQAPVVIAVIAVAPAVAPCSNALTAEHLQPDSASDTSVFLRNAQFRI